MRIGQREQPARERREPGVVVVGQRPGEQRPTRARAHRRDVGQVHREDLVAEALGIGAGEEMAALDHHVDREHQLVPGRGRDHRRVVADADTHGGIARRPREMARDQRELAAGTCAAPLLQPHAAVQPRPRSRVRAAISGARTVGGVRSSTPLTNLWPSVPP